MTAPGGRSLSLLLVESGVTKTYSVGVTYAGRPNPSQSSLLRRGAMVDAAAAPARELTSSLRKIVRR